MTLEQPVAHALLTSLTLTIFYISTMADISDDDKLGGKLVMRFSQILDSADVPNVLWGNYLLTIYGIPTITDVCISFSFLFFFLSDGTIAEQMIGRSLCRS